MNPFAFERVRLMTLRSTWILAGLSVIACALIGLLSLAIGPNDVYEESQWASGLSIMVPNLTGLLSALVGVFAFGHEYRYGTIRPTLTAIPKRVNLAAAKILVAMLWAFLVGTVSAAINFGVAALLVTDEMRVPKWSGNIFRSLLGQVLFCVGLAMLGAGLTALTRNQVVGVVGVIVYALVIENAIIALTFIIDALEGLQDWVRYLPIISGRFMYIVAGAAEQGDESPPLTPLTGGLVFFFFATLLCVIGTIRFAKTDA
jgi:ABC-2 type transport system permease protein